MRALSRCCSCSVGNLALLHPPRRCQQRRTSLRSPLHLLCAVSKAHLESVGAWERITVNVEGKPTQSAGRFLLEAPHLGQHEPSMELCKRHRSLPPAPRLQFCSLISSLRTAAACPGGHHGTPPADSVGLCRVVHSPGAAMLATQQRQQSALVSGWARRAPRPTHAAPAAAPCRALPAALHQRSKRLRAQPAVCQAAAVAEAPKEERFDPQVGRWGQLAVPELSGWS